MLNFRITLCALLLAPFSVILAQGPGSTPAADFFVHHKHVSIDQYGNQEMGSAVAIGGDVLLASDDAENVEILRKNGDGTWSYEASLAAPSADIAFGSRHAMATNGDWIAIGAKLDDSFGSNSGAVHMYKYDGAAWDYRGALSHMAPFGSIITDQFGMALAMDGDRMVVGSRAENGVGAAGAVHYFTYNTWLDMWLETGFVASEHTSGNSTSKFAESVDISGDWMIVGEHRNNTNGQFAGAAHIYEFYNQCWHLSDTFYGDEAGDWLGYDVAISGSNAAAGAPHADTNGLNEAGAAKLYQLVPFSGSEEFWSETFDITAPTPVQGDWFGHALDMDGDLLLVGAPRDDDDVINGGVGYFMFDCSTDNYDCVAEGLACDAMQNDRLGMDVALSNGLGAVGAPLDDNIFEDAGSVYVLGANDTGFECDLTAPGAPMVDLVDANDTGADNSDNLTRHTTPDFDLFLPDGGSASAMNAQPGDLLTWYLEDPAETETLFLTADDIESGLVTMDFVYPGPVLPDGEYTFCSYITDIYGNIGDTGCLTIIVDNEDPEPAFENGAEYDTSNTDTYGAYLPGASDPADCEALAAASGGTYAGIINDAEANMVTPGCYITGGTPYQASNYEWQALANVLPDTTLYLDAMGDASLELPQDNISATDNIAMDTLFSDITTFDCSDVGLNTITLTAIDMAGNYGYSTFQVEIVDNVAPEALTQNALVELDASGNGSITTADIDNGSNDACGIASLTLDQTAFDCSHVSDPTSGSMTLQESGLMAPVANVNWDLALTLAPLSDPDSHLEQTCVINVTSLPEDGASWRLMRTNALGNWWGATPVPLTLGLNTISASAVTFNRAVKVQFSDGEVEFNALSINGDQLVEAPDSGVMVILTVIDNNGNTSTATATVTVVDNIAPEALTQDVLVELDASGNGSITTADIDNGSNDACGIASLSLDQTAFDCSHVGERTVTLTVTDNNGNASTATATVTVEDNVAPEALTQDVLVELDASGNGSITTADIDNGSNDACGIASLSLDQTAFDCSHVGERTVTLTVTDNNGNASTATATVTVEDNVAPEALTQNALVELDASGNGSITTADIDNGSNDACGIASLSLDQTAFDCSHVGERTVTLTVTDNNGNASTATATVTVEDNVAPEALTQDVLVELDASGNGSITTADIDNGSNDACGIASLSLDQTAFDCSHVGERTVTLTVTDNNGNASTATATVTVEDNVAPEALTQNALVELDASGNGSITTADIDNGSNDACGIASLSLDQTAFDCSHVGERTVTLTVTDNNGNASTATATVTVEDNVAPEALTQNALVELDASGNGSITTADIDNGSNDACGIASLSLDQTAFDCSHVGERTVTLTVTDNNGNASTATATVTVEDNVAPEALTQDVLVELDASGNGSITTADIDNGSNDACGIASLSLDQTAFDCSHVGERTVTLTVTDNNGNASTATATVTVEDNVAPEALTQNALVELDASGNGSITTADIDNGSNDACGIASLSLDQTAFDCSHVGERTVTLTVTDNNGNASTATATVTVEDNVAPEALTQDVLVELDASGNGSITTADIDNGSNDACGIASLSLDQTAFDCSHVGERTVTLTVTDNNGNASTATATVTVEDNVAPEALTQDVLVELDASGNGSITTADIDNGSNDACGIASLSLDQTAFDCSHVGERTVTLTVTDNNGNASTATATVTVEDNVAPEALTQNALVELDASGNGSITTADIDNGSNDACGIASLSLDQTAFDCSHVGERTVTLTVTDNNGNASTATATVTVEDNVAPEALTQDVLVELDASGNGSITTADIDNGSNDACGIASLSLDQTAFDCSHVGERTVTLTVTDNNGNASTATATVTVEDNVAPEALTQDVLVELDASGNGSITTADIDNGSNDACGIASLSLDQTAFDCSHVGERTVTLTVTDNNGNASTATATVTVEDNVAPEALTQNALVELDASGNGSITTADIDNGSNDACGIASLSLDQTAFDCSHVGERTVTLTVTDNNGNASTATATVTVEDNIAPVATITCPADYVIDADSDCEADVSVTAAGMATATATDNCTVDDIDVTYEDGAESSDCQGHRTFVRTFTAVATDESGNDSDPVTCTQTITVNDNTNPTITVAAESDVYERDGNEAAGFASWLSAQAGAAATDNCSSVTWTHNSTGLSDGCGSTGSETVTFTATDDCGNFSTTEATFTVEDNYAPSCPAIDLVDASDNGLDNQDNLTNDDTPTMRVMFTGSSYESAEAGDVVELYIDGALSQTTTIDQADVDNGYAQFETGPFADGPVSFSARHIDDCGQASIFAFLNINIHSTDPVAVAEGLTVFLDGNGNASIEPEDLDGGSSDDYNVLAFSADQTSFDCSDLGDNTVTLTVTDIAGNTHSSSAAVEVVDNIEPSISTMNITVELDASGSATISPEDVAEATDNCHVSSLSLDIDAFDCSNVGDMTVTITAIDQSGNSATATATVTVQDNLGPVVESITDSGEPNPVAVTFTFTTDSYGPDEASARITNSEDEIVYDYPVGYFPSASTVDLELPLDPGTYTITLGDGYGDGWNDSWAWWGSASGENALVISGGASGSLDFTFGAEVSTEFTIEAPAIEGVPQGITVELGADGTVSIEPADVVASATDNCGIDDMSLDISSFDCNDLGSNTLTLTVTDVNGNSTSVPAYVTVEDNEVPVVNIFDLEDYTLYAGETCVDEVDLFAAGQPWYETTDNCDTEVNILYDEINDTGIAGCREFDRRWIIEAVDAAGNVGRDTTLQHIVVMDGSAPMVFFDNAPDDMTIELGADCTGEIPGAGTPLEFSDVTFTYTLDQYATEGDMTIFNSEGDVVEFIDLAGAQSTYDYNVLLTNGLNDADGYTVIQTLSLAPGDYFFLLEDSYGDGWVWNSVDGTDALVISGNASGSWDFSGGSELTGGFTVNEALAVDISATATDNCTNSPAMSDLTYVDSAPEYICEDAGSYVITRTFSVTATDDCGNETVAEHIQTLTFLDVTAPQITNSEGIDNGETLSEAAGGDIFDFIFVPNPINLDAEDACGGAVTIAETESFSGFIPTDDIGNYCGASTPAAFIDGDACNGGAPVALVLEGAYFNGEGFTIADGGVNIVESFYDETLHIELEMTNADGTGGFIWSADYNEAFNWAQWSSLGRGYKKDCADILPGTSPWSGWEFLVMQTGGMIGTGIYAGSELSLTHQPMNHYYGMQIGLGANNVNAKYGASAWFYWSGELVVNGIPQEFQASSGDIMLDLDCTMPWSVEYGYTVSDACGNTTSFSYTVEGDESNAGGAYVSGDESSHQPFDISVVGDIKEPIRVTGLMPNPTDNVSQLGFVVSNNMRLRVDLYNMSGELVLALYDGNAMTDVEYLMNIDVEGLEAGMYQIRIASNTYMAVKKLLVTQ